MSIFRTPEQAALQDVLKAAEESIGLLNDAAHYVESAPVSEELRQLAEDRRRHVEKLQHELRSLGDLPGTADPDRLSAEKVLHHLHAWMTPEKPQADLLEQHAAGEQQLGKLIADHRREPLGTTCECLLEALGDHVSLTRQRLEALAASMSG
jgi:hypothetical protein